MIPVEKKTKIVLCILAGETTPDQTASAQHRLALQKSLSSCVCKWAVSWG